MTGPFGRLLHLGNVVVDVAVQVPGLPERGGDLVASAAAAAAGGGFNVMAAAARQGLPVAYAGAYGSGPFAALALAALRDAGITVLLPPKAGLDTGFVLSMVEADGERTFVTSPGAEATLTEADLAPVTAGPRDAVYLSGYGLAHPSNAGALAGWLRRLDDGRIVFFDPGPLAVTAPAGILAQVQRRADWLTCNAVESARLTGRTDPAAAAADLTRRAARPAGGVVVRTGAAGCLVGQPGRDPVPVPGFAVAAVDTTGAGDAHAGAFIAALAGGADPVTAARSANAAAAISATRRGPATAPAKAELDRFLRARSS
jgi:sugar/nucleoside kinase (ribokinase family)